MFRAPYSSGKYPIDKRRTDRTPNQENERPISRSRLLLRYFLAGAISVGVGAAVYKVLSDPHSEEGKNKSANVNTSHSQPDRESQIKTYVGETETTRIAPEKPGISERGVEVFDQKEFESLLIKHDFKDLEYLNTWTVGAYRYRVNFKDKTYAIEVQGENTQGLIHIELVTEDQNEAEGSNEPENTENNVAGIQLPGSGETMEQAILELKSVIGAKNFLESLQTPDPGDFDLRIVMDETEIAKLLGEEIEGRNLESGQKKPSVREK